MLCTKFQLFQALFNVKLYYQLPIWLIVAFKVMTLTNYVNQFSLNLFSWFSHPRKPRGGQLGQEKRRRKFSRTGERTPEMLFVKNQFHDLFECLSVLSFVPNQKWSSYTKEFTCKFDCSPYYRRFKLKLRVWNVNLLSHKRVGVALQAIVESWYEK